MDPNLLKYYSRELQHVREMGGEFAKEFPKVAGRLALEGFECADPYVERLLEGFAFLAGRVQLKLDAEFPRFTQHLLEMVYPHYLSPTPSMTVVRLQPDPSEGSLAEGFRIDRNTVLRSQLGKGEQTACEYRTAQDVVLWPLEVVGAEYFPSASGVGTLDVPAVDGVKAGMRLRLRAGSGLTFDKLNLDSLRFFLDGGDDLPMRIYEQLVANSLGVVVRPASRPAPWQEVLGRANIRPIGFDDEDALLPYGARSFQGYRLLQEYFSLPQRFMFVEFDGLDGVASRCTESELDLIVLLDRADTRLEKAIETANFALYCTPAINLFPKRLDRIHISEREPEHHVVPDRTRPMDFEVYAITSVVGHGGSTDQEREFMPFYASTDLGHHDTAHAYYTVTRQRRLLSSRQRRTGPRSSYVGSEVFLGLVDAREVPYSSDLRQISVRALCTNRDLPLHMPVGKGKTDFTLVSGAPVQAARCLAGPTRPRPSFAQGDTAWRLISHLSLNYLSVVNSEDHKGAAGLRELLSLYCDPNDAATQKQIEGVRDVTCRPIIRRVTQSGPITFGRGMEITVTCEEAAFEGTGVFLLGAVLERFFGRYASINSFTETVLRSTDRGEIHRWPMRTGSRLVI